MKFIAAILLSCTLARAAGTVSLAWSPSPTPNVTRQTVYLSHDANFASGVVKQSFPASATNGVISSSLLAPGQWFAAVTASVGGAESLPSASATVTVVVPRVTVQYWRGAALGVGVQFDERSFDETNGVEVYWLKITR